jgi:hypothetical protein
MVLTACESASVTGSSVSESAGAGMVVSVCKRLVLVGNVIESFGQDAEIVRS